jgi:iron complex transport system ATP-binding protein
MSTLPADAASSNAVLLQNVRLAIGGVDILHGVDWVAPAGARAAILGPNGSGKSTLLRMITGYLHATAGSVHCLGEQIGKTNVHELRKHIGVVDPGGPFTPDPRLSALDVVLTGFFGNLCLDFDEPTPEQRDHGVHVLSQVGLATHARQLFTTLSTGEQRRVLIARAMVRSPELLILDEPTSGLDLRARETVLATIDLLLRRRPELTALLVTHHLEELLPGTSSVLLLSEGKAARVGRPDQVLDSSVLSSVFGCPVVVRCEHGRWSWSVQPAVWDELLASES